ncbi:MAG: creatininase family protein, partial [Chloroflexota bacterium]
MANPVELTDLITTATSTDERRRAAKVAVLPVGSFEQHGDFLPLITDTVVACLIARRISTAHDLLLLPPITLSCSHEHAAFAGTVSISARTLYTIIADVHASLRQAGVAYLVLVNGHGGNYVLANVVQEANVGGAYVVL